MRHNARLSWYLCGLCLALGLLCPVYAQPSPSPSPATTATVSPTEAHAVLDRVLARREFRENRIELRPIHRTAFQRWLASIWTPIRNALNAIKKPLVAFGRWLKQIFQRLQPKSPVRLPNVSPEVGKSLRYTVFFILIVGVVYLLGLLITRLLEARRDRTAPDALEEIAADPIARRKHEPTFWEKSLQQADALWQQGNQREALRVLYRACLVLMDARGILRYDESRANGEVLRELRRQGKGPVQQALRPIVHSFDRSWYGFLTISGDEFTQVKASSQDFREAVTEKQHG